MPTFGGLLLTLSLADRTQHVAQHSQLLFTQQGTAAAGEQYTVVDRGPDMLAA
jgi:hypothetical protein